MARVINRHGSGKSSLVVHAAGVQGAVRCTLDLRCHQYQVCAGAALVELGQLAAVPDNHVLAFVVYSHLDRCAGLRDIGRVFGKAIAALARPGDNAVIRRAPYYLEVVATTVAAHAHGGNPVTRNANAGHRLMRVSLSIMLRMVAVICLRQAWFFADVPAAIPDVRGMRYHGFASSVRDS